jgi:transposase
LYIGIELSAASWLLVMGPTPDSQVRRRLVQAGDRRAVAAAIAEAKRQFRLPAGTPVRSCYEAGRDGFWPHRLLTQLGVDNLVVDSSSIEVNRRTRRAKTDKLDGAKLRRMLWRWWQGERDLWHAVQVPSREREDERQASRALTSLQEDRTRYRNRIHSLLALHGVRVALTPRFAERLAQVRDWEGQPLPAHLQTRVLQEWRLLQHVEAERRRRQKAERAAIKAAARPSTLLAAKLVRLRGVGDRTATIVSEELLMRQPRNRREIGGLLGFGALPFDSGARRVDQGISPSGVRAIRRIAVDLAWGWLRYQPRSALSRWYQGRWAYTGKVGRRIGIVAVARRLMIALWRYARDGVVPKGAQLKVA